MDKIRTNNVKSKGVQSDNEEQGFILIIGVIVMTALLPLALSFLLLLSFEYRLTDKSYKASAALSLAEAGVERAIWELNYGDISTWTGSTHLRTMTISSFQAPGGKIIGDIEIRVEEPGAENPVVESTGRAAYTGSLTVDRVVRVALGTDKYKPWTYGIFGDEELDFSSNVVVDSYDSRNGSYDNPGNVGSDGHVGTNASHYGCIDLSSNAKIYGNAYSGPESIPDLDIITRSNSHVYGEKLSLSTEIDMPSVSPPEDLLYMGDYFLDSNSSDTISENGAYTSFRVESNSTVTILADVTLYITGDFSMLSNTQLEIANDAHVTLYLGGTFEQRSNSQINNLSQNPAQLMVLGTDSFNGIMEWHSNTQFFGSVYVPKADVTFGSNSDFYGSISAKSIEFNSKARIHYDVALANSGIDGTGGAQYTVKSWQEVVPSSNN